MRASYHRPTRAAQSLRARSDTAAYRGAHGYFDPPAHLYLGMMSGNAAPLSIHAHSSSCVDEDARPGEWSDLQAWSVCAASSSKSQ